MDDSPEVLRELLEKIAKQNDFSRYDIVIKPTSSGGANYTSQLYLAKILNDSNQLDLFAKVITLGENLRSRGYDNFFETEPLVYTELSDIYQKLEEKHSVSEENRFQFPKFYDHSPTRGQEAVVLEDLSAQGYSVYDRLKPMDLRNASKAIEEMAKLHALSFAFEQEYPEEFEKLLKKLKYPAMDQDNIQELFVNAIEQASKSVTNEKNKQRFQEFVKNKIYFVDFTEYTKPLRCNVLMHGDFRMSNLMYRVDNMGNYQLKILDYQTVRAGSPVVDLLYFIMTATDEEFRAKHYLSLLDYYYSQLSLAMQRLGLKSDEIYSREDLAFEINTKLPYLLTQLVLLLPVLLSEEEDSPIIDKGEDFSALKINNVGKYYPERVNGIINDYIKWNIF